MSKTSLKSTQERKEPVLAWSLWLGPGTEKILKQRSQKLLLQRLVEKQIKYQKRIRSTLLSRLTSFTSSPWLDGTPGLGKRNPRKSLMFWLPVLHPPSTQKFESTWTSSSSGGRSGDPEETFLLKPCCGSTKPPRDHLPRAAECDAWLRYVYRIFFQWQLQDLQPKGQTAQLLSLQNIEHQCALLAALPTSGLSHAWCRVDVWNSILGIDMHRQCFLHERMFWQIQAAKADRKLRSQTKQCK